MNLPLLQLLLSLTAAAPTTGPPAYTLQQYMGIKRSNDPIFSPDADRIAFSSNASGGWQLWLTPAYRWQPKQITRFNGNALGRWSPTGSKLLVMADRNGDN